MYIFATLLTSVKMFYCVSNCGRVRPDHTPPNCAFTPKAHKEENDHGSHSLCIGSQADKEGKRGIGGLGWTRRLRRIKKVKNPPTLCK